jgi:hypothetical protein
VNPVKWDVLLGAVESFDCVGAETVRECFVLRIEILTTASVTNDLLR